MESSLRKLRGFALQRHEQRVDRDRDRCRGHSTATAATAADELLVAAQDMTDMRSCYDNLLSVAAAIANSAYAFCVVATESAGRQIPMAFLEMIKEDFNKRYAGGKAAMATANSLTRDFGPRLRDQMQYCTDHPEEVSKLYKVKAQVDQVKSIMMENIDKIVQNLAAIRRNAGWRQKQENKRKMEALNLRHLSAVIKEAPKTPSPLKPKRRRIIEDAVVVPSPPRRSRRLAQLPEVKYAEIAPHTADRMTRSPRKPADLIYMARSETISMKARLEATKKAEELESQLDPDIPSFVKAMLH